MQFIVKDIEIINIFKYVNENKYLGYTIIPENSYKNRSRKKTMCLFKKMKVLERNNEKNRNYTSRRKTTKYFLRPLHELTQSDLKHLETC